MPKKTIKSTRRKTIETDAFESVVTPKPIMSQPVNIFKRYKTIIIVAAVILLGYFAWQKGKGLVLAGSVNGSLISKMELNSRLKSQFGTQMLEVLIGEKIIMGEAKKRNITASNQEIDDKIKEFESTLGQGVTLDDMLKQRGMTKNDLLNQVKLQVTIDKMFSKDVSISAMEIEDYAKTNAAYLTASGAAEKLNEAEKQLKSSKIEQLFTEWFTKARDSASILRFL